MMLHKESSLNIFFYLSVYIYYYKYSFIIFKLLLLGNIIMVSFNFL